MEIKITLTELELRQAVAHAVERKLEALLPPVKATFDATSIVFEQEHDGPILGAYVILDAEPK